MSIAVRKLKGVSRVRVEDEMTIYSAATMRESLLAALAKGDEFEVNLEKVTEIDTAGAQLLLAFKQACDHDGKDLRVVHPSPPVVDVLAALGMAALFSESEAQSTEG